MSFSQRMATPTTYSYPTETKREPPVFLMVRYSGRYWKFLYRSEVVDKGNSFVSIIPTGSEEYQTWLSVMRSRFSKWDAALDGILRIATGHISTIGQDDKAMMSILEEAFDAHLVSVPTYDNNCPPNEPWCVYTFDLDLEVFSIHNEAHYRLGQVPRDRQWIRGLCIEDDNCYFVIPARVPHQSLANLCIPKSELSNKDKDYWNFLETRQVVPGLTSEASVPFQVRWKLFELFRESQADILSISLLSWTAEDLPFRELAYFIICLAFGGEYLTIVDMCSTLKARWTDLYRGIGGGAADRELVSSVCSGFHLRGKPMGSAPESSKYWFEQALICLVPRLDRYGVAPNAIADAIRYGRDQGRISFNAVLISIAGLVLVRSFPDGSVEHSPIMPLMNIQGYRAMDATQRYGENWLQAFTDMTLTAADDRTPGGKFERSRVAEKGIKKKDITKGESRKPRERTCWSFLDADLPDDEDRPSLDRFGYRKAEYEDEEPEESWTIRRTFSRFVNFWDATVWDTLKPTGANAQALPYDIVKMILSHITDKKTWDTCAKVSRSFRDICAKRHLIMDDLVFSDSPPKDCDEENDDDDWEDDEEVGEVYISFLDWPEQEARRHLKRMKEREEDWRIETISRLWEDPEFYVVRQSTGRLMTVKLGKGNRLDQKTAFEFVIGSERNRKSFCTDCPLSIIGLDIPTDSQVGNYASSDIDAIDEDRDAFQPGYGSWDELDNHRHKTTWHIDDLCALWKDVMDCESYGMGSATGGLPKPLLADQPWMMPPNTRQYFVTTESRVHVYYAHLIYLRIKRASRYVDILWDDIIQEAKDGLAMMIEVPVPRFQETPDTPEPEARFRQVGKANPNVILAIGLEVRLFEWHHTPEGGQDGGEGGTLTETAPGRIYSLRRKKDRKPVDEAMRAGYKRLKAAKRIKGSTSVWAFETGEEV